MLTIDFDMVRMIFSKKVASHSGWYEKGQVFVRAEVAQMTKCLQEWEKAMKLDLLPSVLCMHLDNIASGLG